MTHQNIKSIYQKYDTFFVDVYGVIYDGLGFYDGALDMLEFMKKSNKKIIILSNTTMLSEECKIKYGDKGLKNGIHYDEFLTSGEIFRKTVNQIISGRTLCQIFNRNINLFENSGLQEVSVIREADFIYVGVLHDKNKFYTADDIKTKNGKNINIEDMFTISLNEIEGFEKILNCLNECLKYDKTLFVVNPDIFAIENVFGVRRPVLCQGAVGQFYERMGGRVEYFGKPYQKVYDFAKSLTSECEKIAMIGDTPWTDILGGNMASVDTVLVLTGVSGKFLSQFSDMEFESKFEKLLSEISPKMTHEKLKEYSQNPNSVLESFA